MSNKNVQWHRLNSIVLLVDIVQRAVDSNERILLREIVREIGDKATDALKEISYEGESHE